MSAVDPADAAVGAGVDVVERAGWPEAWQRTETTASAPNEQVFLTLVGDHTVRLRLAPGYYHRVRRDQLEQSLSQTVRLMWAARSRLFLDLLATQWGHPAVSAEPAVPGPDPEDAEYARRMAVLPAEGVSPDGRVRLTAVGTRATATIAPGTLEALDEATFCAYAEAAGRAFLADHYRNFDAVRYDVYWRAFLEGATG